MLRPAAAALLSALAFACRAETLDPSTSTSGDASTTDAPSTSDDTSLSTSSGGGDETGDPESSSSGGSTSDGPGSTSGSSSTSEPATSSSTSTTAPAPTCGDGQVDDGEVCDYGVANSDSKPDMCRTDCTPARCGDGVIDSGEECDDKNVAAGDGCSEACVVELECGKTFTTWWCKQLGPTDQHTRCAAVEDGGRTCVLPEIRYGTNDGGIPQALGDDAQVEAAMTTWCQQLGFAGWSGALDLSDRDCYLPRGPVYATSVTEEAVWHWGEGPPNNKYWRGPAEKLNEKNATCAAGRAVQSIGCTP